MRAYFNHNIEMGNLEAVFRENFGSRKKVMAPLKFEWNDASPENQPDELSINVDYEVGIEFFKQCAEYLYEQGIKTDQLLEAEIRLEGAEKQLRATKDHLEDLQHMLNLHVEKEGQVQIKR